METRIKMTALLGTCALLAGCGQADAWEILGEDLRMSVVASIGGTSQTAFGRYAGSAPNDADFTDGDAIGMAVDNGDFVKWNYNGTTWLPEGNTIYWEDKEKECEFFAFYPYAENASFASVPMPSLAEQDGTMGSVSKCDFLVATTKQNYGDDGTVSFTDGNAFSHVSSLVALTIKGGGDLASATLDKISLSGTNLVTTSTYSFEEKKVNLSTTETNNLSVAFTNHAVPSSGETFYLLLNAATVNLSEVTLSIHYTIDGVKYKAEKTGINKETGDKFIGGYQYAYNISIVDKTLKISGNKIKPWDSGESLGNITLDGKKEESQS